MTPTEINRIADLFIAANSRIPVCPHIWREMQLARIGPATVKGNKVKPIDKASVSQKIGRKKKADRIEKGLRANREKKR